MTRTSDILVWRHPSCPRVGLAACAASPSIKGMSEHDWFTQGLTKGQIQEILNFYKSRYQQ